MKRMTTRLRSLGRRLGAAGLAAGTLWAVTVTAGSETAAGAWKALRESSPMGALRWELGELWVRDTLSPAAVLTLGNTAPLYYLPVLLGVSLLTGALTGLVSACLFRALAHTNLNTGLDQGGTHGA